jgi:ubiquitin carboxyl-terminal hydrolase 7
MFSETKKRLQNRVGMSDKDFAKVKFSIILSRELDPKAIEEGECFFDKGVRSEF